MDAIQLLTSTSNMQWDYDQDADVLYISAGKPQAAVGVDLGDGLVLRYSEDKSAIVGLTVIGLKSRLEQSEVAVSISE